jgi:hypothetical protein
MRQDIRQSIENEIIRTALIRRCPSIQSNRFKDLFQGINDWEIGELRGQANQLWEHLILLILIIRRRPGASIKELSATMSLSPRQIRNCLKLVINLGGEVELICGVGQRANEGRFLLHI